MDATYILGAVKAVRKLSDEKSALRRAHGCQYLGYHLPPFVFRLGYRIVLALMAALERDDKMLFNAHSTTSLSPNSG